MRNPIAVLGLLALLGLPLSSQADGLYDVEVLVDDQSEDVRQDGAREGLRDLMVRLSGREDAASSGGAAEIIQQSSRYLQQFDYGEPEEDGDEVRERLRLRFDGEMLERAMQEAGIPVWAGTDRGSPLVWLVVQRGGERLVVGGDTLPDGQQALRRAGNRHGLPLTLPLMDLEDQRGMDSSDLWGGFREPILEASARYEADTVLVARLDQRGNGWQGRWIVFRDGLSHELTVQGDDPAEVVDRGVEAVAGRLARELAAVAIGRDAASYRVRVSGISNLSDFAWVQRTLERARGVGLAEAGRVDGDRVEFHVTTSLDRSELARVIADVRRLEREDVEPTSPRDRDDAPDLGFSLR